MRRARHPSELAFGSPFSRGLLGLSPSRSLSCSEQVSERPQVEVEVAVFESEMLLELAHPLLELHERLAKALDLLLAQGVVLHAPQRLPLHQLAKELDECEDELREPPLDLLRICVHAPRKGRRHMLQLPGDPREVHCAAQQLVDRRVARAHASPSCSAANEYGGHGPVQMMFS